MTQDELFTLVSLRMGAPKLITQIHSGGKQLTPRETLEIDYTCEFISILASSGHPVTSKSQLMSMYAKYEKWYERNILASGATA